MNEPIFLPKELKRDNDQLKELFKTRYKIKGNILDNLMIHFQTFKAGYNQAWLELDLWEDDKLNQICIESEEKSAKT